MNVLDKAAVLAEILPWMAGNAGKTTVVKYGGAAMKEEGAREAVAADLALMSRLGARIVLVHGGGPEIDAMLRRLSIEPCFVGGLRRTDEATMEVVQMVLCGKVNKEIVAAIGRAGGSALGLCGLDGGLLRARKLEAPGADLGRVGEIVAVDTRPLVAAMDSGYLPVVATVAADESGRGAYNVNADTAAAEIAVALGAEELILLTDVPGILRDVKDPSSLVAELPRSELAELARDGVVSKGMIPKVECCARALEGGVRRARILDGREPRALLSTMFAEDGGGTVIR